MTNAYSKSNITGGGFQNNQGVPLSGGYLTFQLSHDSNVSTLGGPTGIQVVAGQTTHMLLDSNGNLCPNQYLWTNDNLSPSGSYYKVIAYDSSGIRVWNTPQIMYIEPYATQINIGTLIPNTP